jgi:RimJ/RimL family protein N-acetyltransferase
MGQNGQVDAMGYVSKISTQKALIRDTNLASQNVAKRNGMSIRGTFTKHYYGIDMRHNIFSVKRDDNL